MMRKVTVRTAGELARRVPHFIAALSGVGCNPVNVLAERGSVNAPVLITSASSQSRLLAMRVLLAEDTELLLHTAVKHP